MYIYIIIGILGIYLKDMDLGDVFLGLVFFFHGIFGDIIGEIPKNHLQLRKKKLDLMGYGYFIGFILGYDRYSRYKWQLTLT